MVDQTSPGSESVGDGPVSGSPPVELRKLINDHYRDVYRYAYRLCGREADAEDLTQQAFLVAHSKLNQLREPEKADRWLFAVLRSCFLKSVGRPRPLFVDTLELIIEDSVESHRESQAVDREELQQALNDLSEEYRLVVLMFYFDELSYKEIAEQLEIPIGTVMSRLARAKQRLRQRIFDEPANRKVAGAPRPRVQIGG